MVKCRCGCKQEVPEDSLAPGFVNSFHKRDFFGRVKAKRNAKKEVGSIQEVKGVKPEETLKSLANPSKMPGESRPPSRVHFCIIKDPNRDDVTDIDSEQKPEEPASNKPLPEPNQEMSLEDIIRADPKPEPSVQLSSKADFDEISGKPQAEPEPGPEQTKKKPEKKRKALAIILCLLIVGSVGSYVYVHEKGYDMNVNGITAAFSHQDNEVTEARAILSDTPDSTIVPTPRAARARPARVNEATTEFAARNPSKVIYDNATQTTYLFYGNNTRPEVR